MKWPTKEEVEQVRQTYPPGTIVRLVRMDDPQAPPPGTTGKVIGVDDTASLLVEWQFTQCAVWNRSGEEALKTTFRHKQPKKNGCFSLSKKGRVKRPFLI